MNAAKRGLAAVAEGLATLLHIAAGILAVRLFVELPDPTNRHPAALIVLAIIGVGLADLVLTWPLRRISTALRSSAHI